MRAIRISFLHMLKFVKKDMMLLAAVIAPFLIGMIIRLGIPFIEKMLIKAIGYNTVLEPYYSLFDIFYAAACIPYLYHYSEIFFYPDIYVYLPYRIPVCVYNAVRHGFRNCRPDIIQFADCRIKLCDKGRYRTSRKAFI